MRFERLLGAWGLAALLGGAVYLNALNNPFVYDDHHTVVQNPSIASVTDVRAVVLGAMTRPVTNLSYAFDRAVWGARPFGFHLTNVLLHMLNVVLLFHLVLRFERDRRRAGAEVTPAWRGGCGFVAFAAAILLAVHPMMTEAVGYISGRAEVLCATFFMLALLAGRRWASGGGPRWAACTVGLWVAALATKETAAMFPFVFLIYDRLAMAGTALGRRRRLLTVHLPLVATTLVAGILRLLIFARVEYPGETGVHWGYALVELDVVRRYLWMMVIPSGQTIFHEVAAVGLLDPRTWLAVTVVGAMLAVSWKLRRANWPASLGMLSFLLVLVPSSVLVVLGQGEPMAEHRVYLASCGLFLAAGAGIGWLADWVGKRLAETGRDGRRGSWIAAAVLGIVVLAFGGQTILRNGVWGDPVVLWRESVDLAPSHPRPRLALGEALQDAGRWSEALVEYQTAIRLRPADPLGYVKAGQCLAEFGQWSAARENFLQAIAVDPGNVSARKSLTILEAVEARRNR